MAEKNDVYLASQGKIYGPFDAAEVRTLRASGEIRRYAYIWDDASASWQPLESPPPFPPTAAVSAAGAGSWDAVCHDHHFALVKGRLINLTPTGGDLVTRDRGDSPSFAAHHELTLNLLDPANGKSINLNVRLRETLRTPDGWTYRIRWSTPPPWEASSQNAAPGN